MQDASGSAAIRSYPAIRGPPARDEAPSAPTDPAVTLGLLSLVLCLIGFLGVAAILYAYKFEGVGAYWHHVATRDLFVLSMGLAASPFLITFIRRAPALYLVLPVALVMFLYPIFTPYGLPFSRDAVFNYSFAQAVVTSGTWRPLLDVTGQAVTYSYFPGGAIYNAEFASLTGLPLQATFLWAFPLFRFLVLPGVVYTIGLRLFGARTAVLGTFLYLADPSIEFNLPTQQDFAVTFFALVVLCLIGLSQSSRYRGGLLAVAILASVLVVISHHVTAYVLGIFLLALLVLPRLLRRGDPYPGAFVPVVFLSFFTAWAAYFLLVARPVLALHSLLLLQNLLGVFAGSSSFGASSGTTFPPYQLAWLGFAVFVVVLGAWFTFRERYADPQHSFATFATLSSFIVGVVALPFVSTGFSFLSLRLLEYIGLILCPASAYWIVERLAPRCRAFAAPLISRVHLPPLPARTAARALPVLLAFLLFTGGSLIPLTTRDQFAPPGTVLIDAPRYVDPNAVSAAQWAGTHLNHSSGVWGDQLVTTTFGAFGHLLVRWNGYPLFAGTGFNRSSLAQLHIGDAVVIDAYMTTAYLPPEFDGPPNEQPMSAIPVADLQKFYNPFYFTQVYENSVFTIFVVDRLPNPS